MDRLEQQVSVSVVQLTSRLEPREERAIDAESRREVDESPTRSEVDVALSHARLRQRVTKGADVRYEGAVDGVQSGWGWPKSARET